MSEQNTLPEEMEVPDYFGSGNVDDYNNGGYAEGWNACLKFLKETDKPLS